MRFPHGLVGMLSSWRPIAPFAALFVLLFIFSVGGMVVIAHEADMSDAARAREAVSHTFVAGLMQLDAAVEMNAATTPIAVTLSDPLSVPASTYAYFTFTSSKAMGYYGTVVLNHDGSAFAGTRFGRPWTGPTLAAAARLIAPVATRLPARGGLVVRTLRRDDEGELQAIAVTNVSPVVGAPPRNAAASERRLAMLAPVAAQIVPKILPSLSVEDFRIGPASDDANAARFAVENGPPIAFAWRPREPGRAAVARWGPVHAALLAAALVMLVFAARTSLAATRALKQLAHHDSLTGLPNRFAFRNELDRRLARGESIALGMIDLNGFKAVNDEHGHLVGDNLLQAVAEELARSAGPGDFVARLGGDEFALLSPSRAAADRFADFLAERLARPLIVGSRRLLIGAAIGIAVAQPGMTGSALMGLADAKLYENKRARRPRRRRASAGRMSVTGAPRRRRQAGL